jgi:hypothetical protein
VTGSNSWTCGSPEWHSGTSQRTRLSGAGVQRFTRLKQQNGHFLFRNWPVLGTARHNQHVARNKFDPLLDEIAIPVVHGEGTFKNQKQLIGFGVMVPHEFSLKLHEANILAIELANHFGRPMIGELRKLRGEVDFGHSAGFVSS